MIGEIETTAARDVNLEVRLLMPGKIYEPAYRIFNTLKYLDASALSNGEIEIATVQFNGRAFLLAARIEDSNVTGLTWLGAEGDEVSHDDIFRGAIIRAAWDAEGINIEHLDTSPLSVESFISGIKSKLEMDSGDSYADYGDACSFTMRVFALEDQGMFVCAYVCNRWVECLHLG